MEEDTVRAILSDDIATRGVTTTSGDLIPFLYYDGTRTSLLKLQEEYYKNDNDTHTHNHTSKPQLSPILTCLKICHNSLTADINSTLDVLRTIATLPPPTTKRTLNELEKCVLNLLINSLLKVMTMKNEDLSKENLSKVGLAVVAFISWVDGTSTGEEVFFPKDHNPPLSLSVIFSLESNAEYGLPIMARLALIQGLISSACFDGLLYTTSNGGTNSTDEGFGLSLLEKMYSFLINIASDNKDLNVRVFCLINVKLFYDAVASMLNKRETSPSSSSTNNVNEICYGVLERIVFPQWEHSNKQVSGVLGDVFKSVLGVVVKLQGCSGNGVDGILDKVMGMGGNKRVSFTGLYTKHKHRNENVVLLFGYDDKLANNQHSCVSNECLLIRQ